MSSRDLAIHLDTFKVKENPQVDVVYKIGNRSFIPEPGFFDGPEINHSEFCKSSRIFSADNHRFSDAQ